MSNGYSGRSLDTKIVTPFIREKFGRLAMKESSWLTRSIEQPQPFTLNFSGKIRNTDVKNAFLRILNDVEVNYASAENYLYTLFALLIKHIESIEVIFTPISERGEVMNKYLL